MLTPIQPNSITPATIKTHGSETRTASAHNPLEAQVQQNATAGLAGVGLDAGTILANVNAEAATAGNRTILQTLALAIAAQLAISRRNDESMESFFLRIAAALDDMPQNERLAVEIRAGLKAMKVQLPDLSAALKQPDTAFAARLSAMAEAPLATPLKTAAAAATVSYLQEGATPTRAAETLAMVSQARTNAEGKGLFSAAGAPSPRADQPMDAKGLQTQLKTLFEPGVAETRMEIAKRVEPNTTALILGTENPPQAAETDAPADAPDAAPQQHAARDETQAEPAPARAETSAKGRPLPVTPHQPSLTAENNNKPNVTTQLRNLAREVIAETVRGEARADEARNSAAPQLQTLLTLKGFAEVITSLPARAAELFSAPANPAGAASNPHRAGAPLQSPAEEAMPDAQAGLHRQKDAADGHHATAGLSPMSEEDRPAAARAAEAEAGQAPAISPAELEKSMLLKAAAQPEAVPFAFVTQQPARDEFQAEAAEEHPAREDEDEAAGQDEPEDEESRRERLARQATEELLRLEPDAEPELKITRDSSESDRAYALYQRMAGF